MRSLKDRLFVFFGSSLGLFALTLGVLQGAMPHVVIGLAVLGGLLALMLVGSPRHRRSSLYLRPPLSADSRPPSPVVRSARRSPYDLLYRALSTLVIGGLLVGMLPPPGSASAASAQPMHLQAPPEQPATQPDRPANLLRPQRPNQPPGAFWADLDGDWDVDEGDLRQNPASHHRYVLHRLLHGGESGHPSGLPDRCGRDHQQRDR